MIKIHSLKKIYRSKKKSNCEALSGINLSLPDTGLVFVLGKSGSGKSTLLNLIGGLDNITDGKIVVNGNDLSAFNESDFCNYRNEHIGFIFQDYHLIDELTVEDNIALSLKLKNEDIGDRVNEALKKVDLEGYGKRYPSELSGGERQRVAIARAIVKNPKIILADEPTGNLDTVTGKAIIELLKRLCQECLVLIVSHNINDANNYADRIIELKSGKIISDKSRNPDFKNGITLVENELVYPENHLLNDDDIELINQNHDKRIIKRSDKFIDTPHDESVDQKAVIENSTLHFKDIIRLCGAFLKNKAFSIILSAFMVSVIMVIMALAQTIIKFDSSKIIESEMKKANRSTILLIKGVDEQTEKLLQSDYRVAIDNTDIKALKDGGYSGNVYPVLNAAVPITSCQHSVGFNSSYFSNNLYIHESLGTLVVDEDFLERHFGDLTYAAALDNPYSAGVIITDYIADSIIATNRTYRGKTYEDILGNYLPAGWSYDSMKINAVIETGYKTKHAELFERMKNDPPESFNALYEDEAFLEFLSDVYESLGFSFSLNPNFANEAHNGRQFFSHGKLLINGALEFIDNNNPYISFVNMKNAPTLKSGEATMSLTKYNQLFGTSYDKTTMKDFVPHTITVTSHRFYDINNEKPLYTVDLKIVALHTASDTFILSPDCNDELIDVMGSADIYYNALYCEGQEKIGKMMNAASDLNYTQQNHMIEGIHTMTKAVDVFIPIFELIAVFLCIGVIFILTSFSSKMINDKMHEIGILKAIGTKNGAIGVIFGMQVALIAALTCVMSTVGYFFFIDKADNILIDSLKRLAPGRIVMDLNFLSFSPGIAAMNCLLILALSAVSIIIPLVIIKRIKPVKIIKAKE